MQALAVNFCEWQERYATDEACAATLADLRWPNGFRCPQCGHGWWCNSVAWWVSPPYFSAFGGL